MSPFSADSAREPQPSALAPAGAGDLRPPVTIVFLDDDPHFLRSLERGMVASDLDWDVQYFASPLQALEWLQGSSGAVIVSDWMMQELDGLEFCRRMRQAERQVAHAYHYIILLTGRQDHDSVITGLECGADDFLAKPFRQEELLARIKAGFRIIQLQHQLRIANEHLLRLATIDPLTGVYNRRRGLEIIQEELERVRRGKESASLLLIDMDKFKQINDTYGHGAGDVVLREVFARVKSGCRKYDSVIRWGGDEILVVCPYATEEDAALIGERVCQAVAETEITLGPGLAVKATVSLGAATVPSGESASLEDVIALADQALYQVKAAGGNHSRAALR